MITIPNALRFARLGVAASLLGAGLLIASVETSAAGEIMPASTSRSQVQAASQSEPEIAPATAKPTQVPMCPIGCVGFGWG